MGQLELQRVGGVPVFFVDGRPVPSRAQLELRLQGRWVPGQFAYPALGADRPSFTMCLEHFGPEGRTEQSVVTIGVVPGNVFRWPR